MLAIIDVWYYYKMYRDIDDMLLLDIVLSNTSNKITVYRYRDSCITTRL